MNFLGFNDVNYKTFLFTRVCGKLFKFQVETSYEVAIMYQQASVLADVAQYHEKLVAYSANARYNSITK